MFDVERMPPQDIDAERHCLGAVLTGEREPLEAMTLAVQPEDFYLDKHRLIAEAAMSLRPGVVDIITVADELTRTMRLEQAGGNEYLRSLMADVFTVGNSVAAHAAIVAHKAQCRRAQAKLYEAHRALYTATTNDVQEIAAQVATVLEPSDQSGFADLELLGDAAVADVQMMRNRRYGELIGDTWGFKDLDAMTNGLQGTKLYVIAGRPAMGKTAVALEICRRNALKVRKTWLVASYEMTVRDLAQRAIISMAGTDGARYRKAQLTPHEWQEVAAMAVRLRQAAIYATGGCRTVTDIRRRALHLRRGKGELGGVLVDYLQLVSGVRKKGDNRTQEVSDISRDLKSLAVELNCPVVAVSQLSRAVEMRPEKRPMLSDLRESGQIEQDAELVMFVYRDEVYNKESEKAGIVELIIAKQRDGPTGTVELLFDTSKGQFKDIERRRA